MRKHTMLAMGMASAITMVAVCATPIVDELAPAVALENAFVSIAEQVGPAVVSIATTQEQSLQLMYHGDPQIDQMLRRMYGAPNRPMKLQKRGLGSGMIISKKGDILTNAHVVQDADKIVVTLPDGREYTCEVRGSDPRSELAVIRITGRKEGDPELPTVKLGDSDIVKPGQWSIALGNPFGITEESDDKPTVTVGVVSAIRSFETPTKDFAKMIQTDAAINPGNSGGPLCNIKGEVIGINTFIISGGAMQNAGISFAIPINNAKAIIAQLSEGKEISYGWLGVDMQEVDQTMAEYFGLKEPKGVLVRDVTPGSPAQKAGLKSGDLLVSIGGTRIDDPNHMLAIVTRLPIGKKTELVVKREQKELKLTTTVGKRPSEGGIFKQTSNPTWRGITVRDLPKDDQFKDRTGVIVEKVDEDSPAANAGLEQGDVITSVGTKAITTAAEFAEAVKDKTEPVLIRTEQGFVVVKPGREK